MTGDRGKTFGWGGRCGVCALAIKSIGRARSPASRIPPASISQFEDLHTVDFADFGCVVPVLIRDDEAIQSNASSSVGNFFSLDPDVIDICDDKLALNRLLLGGEFASLIPPLQEGSGGPYPYIVKKRRDHLGNEFFHRPPCR
jgi:hypothetical protein